MDRVPYDEIKANFLDSYYGYCWTKVHQGQKWTDGEHEIGYAYQEAKLAYDLPIEKLMLEVIALVLGGKRWPQVDRHHYKKIEELLADNKLKVMLDNLPKDERILFERALDLLGVGKV